MATTLGRCTVLTTATATIGILALTALQNPATAGTLPSGPQPKPALAAVSNFAPITSLTAAQAGDTAQAPAPEVRPGGLKSKATSGTDPYLAPAGNRGIDVLRYKLKLTFGGRKVGIENARLNLISRATAPLRSFSLDSRRGLKIDRVRVNGKQARFRSSGGKLSIWRFGTLPANSRMNTKIRYHGQPKAISDPSGRGSYGWLKTPGGIVTYNEPVGASTWVPSNDVFYDKAKWKIDVRVPKGLLGVSTGRLVKKVESSKWTRTVWRMNKPIQPYAQTLAIDKFKTRKGRIEGIRSFVAVAKGSGVSVSTMVKRTRKSIRWLTRRLGAYPYPDTGAIVVSGADSAMETAGRPTYSADPYYTSLDTVLHEQAHQWFGNLLTAANAKDMWIHEGFATYLENVANSGRRGRSLDDIVHDQYVTDGWGKKYHNQFSAVSLDNPTPKYLLNTTVYFRGQAAVHALRATLGEALFWRALRTVADLPHGRTTSTAALVAQLESTTGRDLSSWVTTWLQSKGYQQLPQDPSYIQVLREVGRPLMDAAADWSWRKRGSVATALKKSIKSYAPTNHLRIDKVRKTGSGKSRRVYVDFRTLPSPLYPRDYTSCFVFRPSSRATSLGSYSKLKTSTRFADNTFTAKACPA